MRTSVADDKEMTFEDYQRFVEEAILMTDFRHKNILQLFGIVCEVKERPLVVLPFMVNGDLRSFVNRDDLVCSKLRVI